MSMSDYNDGLKQAYEQPGAIADYESTLPEPTPEVNPPKPEKRMFYSESKNEYFVFFGSLADNVQERCAELGVVEVTGDEYHKRENAKRIAILNLVELDLMKSQVAQYYDDLKAAVAEVAKYVPLNGYFKADDGTVYKLVKPGGQYVHFKDLDYERTKRTGEARGTLSVKEAKDAEANGFQPLPEEQ